MIFACFNIDSLNLRVSLVFSAHKKQVFLKIKTPIDMIGAFTCLKAINAPGRIRTCDLPVRSRALYPLSYKRKRYTSFIILKHSGEIVNLFLKVYCISFLWVSGVNLTAIFMKKHGFIGLTGFFLIL